VNSHEDDATLVVSRRIKPGREKEYEDWLRRITATAKGFPGFVGLTTLAPDDPESNVRYMVWRFENRDTLERWKNSPERLKFVEEVDGYASHYFAEATGMETWFALPGMGAVIAPPKWKMASATILGAYVISFLAHLLLNPFLDPWPLFASTLVYIVILVGLLTYFVMPNLSRLLRHWLYP
jgi:hypothetical protein